METVFCFKTYAPAVDACTRLDTTYYLTDSTALKIVRHYALGDPDRPVRTCYELEGRHRPVLELLQQLAYLIDSPIERLPWRCLPRPVAHLLLIGP